MKEREYEYLTGLGYECVEENGHGYAFVWRKGTLRHDISKFGNGYVCTSNAIGCTYEELVESSCSLSLGEALLNIYGKLCVLYSADIPGKAGMILDSMFEYRDLLVGMLNGWKTEERVK